MKNQLPAFRQGDVMLRGTNEQLPPDAKEVPIEGGRIVLRHGEVTGHAHAIQLDPAEAMAAAKAAADAAIGLAGRRARLLETASGTRYLQVAGDATLGHEEHTAHQLPAGLYRVPVQVAFNTANGLRTVAD